METLLINAPALQIKSNLDTIKAQALELVKNYELEVTVENVPEAKALATELNKINTTIKKEVKRELDLLMEPINALKIQSKEIITIIEEARKELLAGIETFNQARRLEHKEKLNELMLFLIEENQVREEFQDIYTDHLTSISGLTKSGELNKASKDKVKQAVTEMLNKQTAYDLTMAQQKIDDEKRIKQEVEDRLEAEREKERVRLEAKHQAELEAQRAEKPIVDNRPPEHRGGDTAPTVSRQPVSTPPPEPHYETPTPIPGKSVYEASFKFRIKAQPGVDLGTVLTKVKALFLKEGVVPAWEDIVEFKGEK